jgi:phosphoglycolate phosphatase-like HAD superfamily hydrolase
MGAIAAGYGYLGSGAPPSAWGADHIIESPGALLALIASRS